MSLGSILSTVAGGKALLQGVFAQQPRQMLWSVQDATPGAPAGSTSSLIPSQLSGNGQAGLSNYITLHEECSDSLQITQHPVEQGSTISDHAYKLPAQLTIRIVWPAGGGNPFGWIPFSSYLPNASGQIPIASYGDSGAALRTLYLELQRAQALRYLVTIMTGKRNYKNMLIESIGVTTDERTENVLQATITFREVILVSTSTVSSPVSQDGQAMPEQTMPLTSTGQSNLVPGSSFNIGPS